MPDDTVQVVGDVGIQASGQVPWFAYPVIVFSSRREIETATPVSIHLIHLAEHPCLDPCLLLKKYFIKLWLQ